MATTKLTTSTSKTMAYRGTHNFKILDFSLLKGMGVGKFIDSDVFAVGRHLWRIKFYPDGCKKDEKGDFYISVLVELVSNCEENLTFCFESYLLDQDGNRFYRDNEYKGRYFGKTKINRRYMNGPFTVNNDCRSKIRGFWDFYKRTDLVESEFLIDDCFTIQCSVCVAKTSSDVHVPQKLAQQQLPLSDLKQSYEQLLESGEGSDVSFEVEGEILRAHKIIISTRSPFFKAQFFGPLKDDNTPCIKIEEIKAPIFKALLHFIYCDDIPDLDSDCVGTIMTQNLLTAADRYGIRTLKSLCESRLCENIAIDSAASTMALAEQHGCFQLKSRCLEFINLPENLQAVMQTDGFKNLCESCPATICELLKSSVARERDLPCDANAKRAKLSK